MVIAMGGGSAIDAGKAVAAMLANPLGKPLDKPGDPLDYLEVIGRGQPLRHVRRRAGRSRARAAVDLSGAGVLALRRAQMRRRQFGLRLADRLGGAEQLHVRHAYVRHDADGHGHQRHTVQLTSTILAEKIARPPVLVIVLQRDQGIEDVEYLAADRTDFLRRNDEDEVVATDVSHESARAEQALDHVVEDPGQEVDDPIAVVVAVAVVEFLEVIEVGVANREIVSEGESPADLRFDRRGSREARRWVDDQIALGPNQHRAQPTHGFGTRHTIANDLVGAGIERRRECFGVLARQHGAGNDCSI